MSITISSIYLVTAKLSRYTSLPQSNMNFLTASNLYLKLFYHLGFSPYQPTNNDRENNFRLSHVIKYIHIATTLFLSVFSFTTSDVQFQTLIGIDSIMFNFVAISCVINSISILIQCVFNKNSVANIIHLFTYIESIFDNKLNHVICFNEFHKNMRLKMFIILLGFIQNVLVYIYRCIQRQWTTPIGCILRLLQLVSVISYIQLIFYVEAACFYWKELNVVIRQNTCHINRQNDLNNIRFYKIVHYHLWQVVNQINTYFGWSFVAVLLYGFIESIYSSYWLFKELRDNGIKTVWSEYVYRSSNIFWLFVFEYIQFSIYSEPISYCLNIGPCLITFIYACNRLVEQVRYFIGK